jgi:hypothetical protein
MAPRSAKGGEVKRRTGRNDLRSVGARGGLRPASDALADVTFFLRAMPSGRGWTWRLFARTGFSGQPRLIYAADRVLATKKEATDRGRTALATACAARAVSPLDSNVAKAG